MKRSILVTFGLALAFAAMLAGCGGTAASSANASGQSEANSSASASAAQTASSEASSADAKQAFVGTWDMVEASQNGEAIDKTGIEALKKNGVGDYYVVFDEDGSFTLVSGANVGVGAWSATSASEGTFAGSNGKSSPMSIQNGQLVMEVDGMRMVFEAGEPRESLPTPPESSASAASSSSASSEKSETAKGSSSKYEVSIDDATLSEDYQGNPAVVVTFSWTNNSEKARSFATALSPKCYQDGVQLSTAIVMGDIDPNGYLADVKPGAGTTVQLAFGLKNSESPVEVEVGEFANFKGEIIASKTFEL